MEATDQTSGTETVAVNIDADTPTQGRDDAGRTYEEFFPEAHDENRGNYRVTCGCGGIGVGMLVTGIVLLATQPEESGGFIAGAVLTGIGGAGVAGAGLVCCCYACTAVALLTLSSTRR